MEKQIIFDNIIIESKHIISINVYDKDRIPKIYQKQKKFLGFTIIKEGFYDIYNCLTFVDEDSEFLIDDRVYLKPRILFKLTDNNKQYIYFNTYKEALDVFESLKN